MSCIKTQSILNWLKIALFIFYPSTIKCQTPIIDEYEAYSNPINTQELTTALDWLVQTQATTLEQKLFWSALADQMANNDPQFWQAVEQNLASLLNNDSPETLALLSCMQHIIEDMPGQLEQGFVQDTIVFDYQRPRLIASVEPDDAILGNNSNHYFKVNHIIIQTVASAVTITTTNSVLICGKDQRLAVYDDSNQIYWIAARDLQAGDRLVSGNDTCNPTIITKLEPTPGPHTLCDCSIDDPHTYCVGEEKILVHNRYHRKEKMPAIFNFKKSKGDSEPKSDDGGSSKPSRSSRGSRNKRGNDGNDAFSTSNSGSAKGLNNIGSDNMSGFDLKFEREDSAYFRCERSSYHRNNFDGRPIFQIQFKLHDITNNDDFALTGRITRIDDRAVMYFHSNLKDGLFGPDLTPKISNQIADLALCLDDLYPEDSDHEDVQFDACGDGKTCHMIRSNIDAISSLGDSDNNYDSNNQNAQTANGPNNTNNGQSGGNKNNQDANDTGSSPEKDSSDNNCSNNNCRNDNTSSEGPNDPQPTGMQINGTILFEGEQLDITGLEPKAAEIILESPRMITLTQWSPQQCSQVLDALAASRPKSTEAAAKMGFIVAPSVKDEPKDNTASEPKEEPQQDTTPKEPLDKDDMLKSPDNNKNPKEPDTPEKKPAEPANKRCPHCELASNVPLADPGKDERSSCLDPEPNSQLWINHGPLINSAGIIWTGASVTNPHPFTMLSINVKNLNFSEFDVEFRGGKPKFIKKLDSNKNPCLKNWYLLKTHMGKNDHYDVVWIYDETKQQWLLFGKDGILWARVNEKGQLIERSSYASPEWDGDPYSIPGAVFMVVGRGQAWPDKYGRLFSPNIGRPKEFIAQDKISQGYSTITDDGHIISSNLVLPPPAFGTISRIASQTFKDDHGCKWGRKIFATPGGIISHVSPWRVYSPTNRYLGNFNYEGKFINFNNQAPCISLPQAPPMPKEGWHSNALVKAMTDLIANEMHNYLALGKGMAQLANDLHERQFRSAFRQSGQLLKGYLLGFPKGYNGDLNNLMNMAKKTGSKTLNDALKNGEASQPGDIIKEKIIMPAEKWMVTKFLQFSPAARIGMVVAVAAIVAYGGYKWYKTGAFELNKIYTNFDGSSYIYKEVDGKTLKHHYTADGKRTVTIIADNSDIPVNAKSNNSQNDTIPPTPKNVSELNGPQVQIPPVLEGLSLSEDARGFVDQTGVKCIGIAFDLTLKPTMWEIRDAQDNKIATADLQGNIIWSSIELKEPTLAALLTKLNPSTQPTTDNNNLSPTVTA